MIRKPVFVVLMLLGLVTAVAWATSYADIRELPSNAGELAYRWDSHTRLCIKSLRGWLRVSTTSWTGSSVPPVELAALAWMGAEAVPMSSGEWPDVGIGRPYLIGIVRTWNSTGRSHNTAVVSVPHWFISTIFLTYPSIAFIRGPLRRWRRHRKGLCLKWGYNLEGNVSGMCSECGEAT